MADGNWPHGPNYFLAPRIRHWATVGRPPPIGLPADQMGLAPGTPVVFGDVTSMGYPQTVLARAQTPPAAPLTMAGMQGASGCGACEAGVSPPGWRGTVQAMKAHPDITNPWALAWWMHGRGAVPSYPEPPMLEAAQPLVRTVKPSRPRVRTVRGGPTPQIGTGPGPGGFSSIRPTPQIRPSVSRLAAELRRRVAPPTPQIGTGPGPDLRRGRRRSQIGGGRRARGAGQIGGEFSYVTDRPETTADAEVVSPGPQPYAYIGVHPAAVPYYQAGQRPPSPCAGLIQFDSQADWLSYRTWWERYYGDAGPCPPPVFAAPPQPAEHAVGPTPIFVGPPSAEPPPTIVDEVERGPGAPLLAPELVPATVLEEPEPEAEPRRVPWAWLVGGTAAAGAIAAGVAYALHRKRKRRRRG